MTEPELFDAKSLGEIRPKPIPLCGWIVVAYSAEREGWWKVFPTLHTDREEAVIKARGLSGHWTKRYVFALDNGEREAAPVALPPEHSEEKCT